MHRREEKSNLGIYFRARRRGIICVYIYMVCMCGSLILYFTDFLSSCFLPNIVIFRGVLHRLMARAGYGRRLCCSGIIFFIYESLVLLLCGNNDRIMSSLKTYTYLYALQYTHTLAMRTRSLPFESRKLPH